MTECNINKSHLILHLYNELEGDEKSIFEAHLQTCQGCQAEIQDYKEILNKAVSLPSIEPSKLLLIEGNSNRRKDKLISFMSYGVIAASFICLAIITYFKLPITKPTDTNQPSYAVPRLRSGEGQQPVIQTTNTQKESFIPANEYVEMCAWDNTLADEIDALQESAITFTANIKTTPLTSLDESIEKIDKNIKSIFAKSE